MKTFFGTCTVVSIVVVASGCGGGGESSASEGSGGATSSTSASTSVSSSSTGNSTSSSSGSGASSTSGTGGAGGSGATSTSGTGGSSGTGGAGGGSPLCGDISTFADGLSPSNHLHVAPGGSDSSGDGSQGNPFATIDHAAGLATPGTAVVVHSGTYAGGGYISNLNGTAAAPIWIGGAPGEPRPILDGGGEAFQLSRAAYVVVHDLEVRNMQNNGINCDDGGDYSNPMATHHILFRGLYIHNIGSGGNQDCLKLSGVNDYFVLDSEMTVCGGSGSGSAVDHVGCHNGLLARNHIHDLTGSGIQCKGGSENIEIRWNRFIEASPRPVNMGGSTGFQFFRPPLSMSTPNAEARNIRVIANVFQGGDCAAAFVGCVDCLFAHNTVIDPHTWFFRILQETVTGGGYQFLPVQNGSWINNLFYFARGDLSGQDINIGPNTDPQSFSVSHNLWYAHDNPGASAPQFLPVMETGGIIGQDPALANVAGGDYHIGQTSPAAGQGVATPGIAGDMDGRCYAMPPSIGAFEAN